MFRVFLTAAALAVMISPALAGEGHDQSSHDHGDHDHSKPELVITPIMPDELKAGEANEVVLYIQDRQAKPVDAKQFEVVHTRPVHLLIINPSLSDYHHEHPEQTSTGQYTFSLTPKTACSYRAWADVQLKGSHQHYIPIDLSGVENCDKTIDKTPNFEASSQGYDFKLELEGDIKVGEAVLARLNVTKDGNPVDFLEPVMGAFAHVVGFYEDYESIAHIHPMGKEPTEEAERGGPVLSFHIEPEQEGYLKLFAQIQIDGKQIFAPFGLMVEHE